MPAMIFSLRHEITAATQVLVTRVSTEVSTRVKLKIAGHSARFECAIRRLKLKIAISKFALCSPGQYGFQVFLNQRNRSMTFQWRSDKPSGAIQ
jgi:hypothetical protein